MREEFSLEDLQIFQRLLETVRTSLDMAVVAESYERMSDLARSRLYDFPAACSARMHSELAEARKRRYDMLVADLAAKELGAIDRVREESLHAFSRVAQIIGGEPGILQKDLYRRVSDIPVDTLRLAIYVAERHGLIQRIKAGSSYRLTLASG
jgi:hypothetical protein